MRIALSTSLTRGSGDGPAFALDFLRTTLDPRLTFSRASSATDIIAGVLTSFATDAPRISASNGLLIEEARTNSIRNSQASGATNGVVGSGGALPTNWSVTNAVGLSTQVMASGSENGFSYVELRIFGTPNATSSFNLAFEGSTQIVAAQNESWTNSFYAKHSAGSLSGVNAISARVVEATAAGTTLFTTDGADIKASLNDSSYIQATATRSMSDPTAGRTRPSLRVSVTNAGAVDFTLRLAAVQHELGAFATSYIPTTTAAATRAADLCSIATGAWYNAAEGSLWAEALSGGMDSAAATGPRLLRLRDSTGQNFHELRRNPADRTLRGATNSNNIGQASFTAEIWNDGVLARTAYAWRSNDIALCFAGNTVQTDSTTPDGMPSGIDTLRLGAAASSSGFWNGYLRAVRVYTRRLSNAQLKAMTL
jgi:hypothetical protein